MRSRMLVLVAAMSLSIDPLLAGDPVPAFEKARASARIAGYSLSKVKRWLEEVALGRIDSETGLYIADGHWNYRDTAADCYPFLVWAAWAVDEEALNGPVRRVLEAETRRILRDRWSLVCRLARALIGKGALTGSEVEDLCKWRLHDTWGDEPCSVI